MTNETDPTNGNEKPGATTTTTTTSSSLPTNDILDERLIDAEYKIWKKNTPYLYDFVLTHSLEWPSLTCQWLPTVRTMKNNTTTIEHQLLLGTHTTDDEPNYLMIASCLLPYDDRVIDTSNVTNETSTTPPTTTTTTSNDKDEQPSSTATSNVEENGTTTTKEATTDPTPTSSSTDNSTNENKKPTTTTTNLKPAPTASTSGGATASTLPVLRYDEEKKEIGNYGLAGTGIGKIEIKMKIYHKGEVNRARYMPQNHFIVASRGPNPEIYIWDVSKHPSFPDKDNITSFNPQGICTGHEQEGYAMAWSPHTTGQLVTGSEDMTVKLWDVSSTYQSGSVAGTKIMAQSTFQCHTATVEDVAFHAKASYMIGSVGDDRRICIWDIRATDNKPTHNVTDAHESDINCIAFNPQLEYTFATGCADSTIAVWDLRNMTKPVSQLIGHNDQVFKVEWCPFSESILGSCSADRRVGLWDLSRIGQEQSAEDAEDGPPELLFLHGGHTNKVSDFSWNLNDEWSVVSVSEDNVLQVWKPAEEIYAEDDDDEEDDEVDDANGNAKKAKVDLKDDDLE